MDLWQHALISGAGSAAIYLATRDASAAAAFSVAGVLVDLDHWPDYWHEKGWNFRVWDFFSHFQKGRPKYLFLAFHAWEWVLVLLGAWSFLDRRPFLLAAASGLLLHLILDQIFNPFRLPGYSFIYRARNRFDSIHIFTPK